MRGYAQNIGRVPFTILKVSILVLNATVFPDGWHSEMSISPSVSSSSPVYSTPSRCTSILFRVGGLTRQPIEIGNCQQNSRRRKLKYFAKFDIQRCGGTSEKLCFGKLTFILRPFIFSEGKYIEGFPKEKEYFMI